MRRLLLVSLLLAATPAFAQQDDDAEAPPLGDKSDQAASKKKKAKTAPPRITPPAQVDAMPPSPAPPMKPEEAEARAQGNLNLTPTAVAPGKYAGVAPGAAALPPHPPRLPLKAGPQRMTWPGFQIKDGVPTVFLELTALPEYRVDETPGGLTVTLKNTTVPLKNNRRPLDVRGFATAVQEVATAAKGHDVRVVIKTRGDDKPAHHERVEDGAGGFKLLLVELPGPGATAASSSNAE